MKLTAIKERALLQGRLQRIPYKQIGARIGKTDLACRLHFHQMVMAKRTPETAPGRSIVFLSSEHPPEVHRLAPLQASHAASEALSAVYHEDRPTTINHLQPSPSFHREPMHRRSYSTPHIRHNGTTGWQPAASPYPNAQSADSSPNMVDLTRLNNIYQQHAGGFWSTIAEKYSGGTPLNPSELEQAFIHGRRVEECSTGLPRIQLSASVPPPSIIVESPPISPDKRHIRGSSHVRSRSSASSIAGKCSVESLLNHGMT